MSEVLSCTESAANWALQRQLALVSETSTGSTNDDAKRAALNESSDFTLYLSAHQSAGRGRGVNSWLDTGAGESLLSTWSFRAERSPQAITAPRIGLALFNAAKRTWPSLPWSLKAPNDLFLDGLKTAGLLVETVTNGNAHRLLVGLGFNVLNHPRRFTEATHLSHVLGGRPAEGDWFRFLDELRAQLNNALADVVEPTLSDAARTELVRALNANPNKAFTVERISPQGDLIFATGQIRWTDL